MVKCFFEGNTINFEGFHIAPDSFENTGLLSFSNYGIGLPYNFVVLGGASFHNDGTICLKNSWLMANTTFDGNDCIYVGKGASAGLGSRTAIMRITVGSAQHIGPKSYI